MIPAMCSTSIYRSEVNWVSTPVVQPFNGSSTMPDTILNRPRLAPVAKTDSVDHDSIPKPACMAREDVDALVSDFPITSPETRCVRFDASNLTEEDDSLQRYYASAIDMPRSFWFGHAKFVGPEVGRLAKIAGTTSRTASQDHTSNIRECSVVFWREINTANI
ncbi:hypothetical protein OIU78_002318 [Salix suchowensis]|nr:hypothetical protein OIU78_002318 [Salix suchowensis]